MLASIGIVLICIPRNVRQVVGPSTLDGFIGALILSQNVSMVWRLVELGGLAVRNHQGSVIRMCDVLFVVF